MTRFPLLGLLLCALMGCHNGPASEPTDAPTAIEQTITVYRLDGDAGRQPESSDTFHAWLILERRTITDSATQQSLLETLQAGIDDPDARAARCFIPRHGIRHEVDGSTMDYVICFQCGSYHSYLDGVRHGGGTIGRTGIKAALDAML